MLKRVWIFVSALLLVVAAVFFWQNNLSAAFVTAALGACAWFLSYRAQMRKETADDEESKDEISFEEPDED